MSIFQCKIWLISAAIDAPHGCSDALDNVDSTTEGHDVVRLICALVAASVASALSLSAGVGGGGILTPIFNIILGLKIKDATALSQVAIAASGLGSAIFNLLTANPECPENPLADIVMATRMIPSLLLGVSFGVLFNIVAPAWLVIALLLVLLVIMSGRTLQTALRILQREREVVIRPLDIVDYLDDCESMQSPLVNHSPKLNKVDNVEGPDDGDSLPLLDLDPHPEVSLEDHENPAVDGGGRSTTKRPVIPLRPILQLLMTWTFFTSIGLWQDEYDRCSMPFLCLYIGQICTAILLTIYFHREPRSRIEIETSDLHHPENCSALVLKNKGLLVCVGSFLAGCIGASVGLGGGILISPLLLELGMHPQAASATSGILVLFASSSASVYFGIQGKLPVDLAVIFGLACGISAFVGIFVLSKIVKRHGTHIVVFILSGMMALGAIATAVGDGGSVLREIADGKLPGFHPFCRQ